VALVETSRSTWCEARRGRTRCGPPCPGPRRPPAGNTGSGSPDRSARTACRRGGRHRIPGTRRRRGRPRTGRRRRRRTARWCASGGGSRPWVRTSREAWTPGRPAPRLALRAGVLVALLAVFPFAHARQATGSRARSPLPFSPAYPSRRPRREFATKPPTSRLRPGTAAPEARTLRGDRVHAPPAPPGTGVALRRRDDPRGSAATASPREESASEPRRGGHEDPKETLVKSQGSGSGSWRAPS